MGETEREKAREEKKMEPCSLSPERWCRTPPNSSARASSQKRRRFLDLPEKEGVRRREERKKTKERRRREQTLTTTVKERRNEGKGREQSQKDKGRLESGVKWREWKLIERVWSCSRNP